jgi:hypothetical protein
MKSKDYTTGCDILAQISNIGGDIDKMDIPIQEKVMLVESLKQSYDVINLWLIRGRNEAEKDKGQVVSFWQFLKNVKNLFYEAK